MKVSNFVRDKRSPVAKSVMVSRVMSANRAKNSKPELILRKLLSTAGVSGYRLHSRGVPGRPDIAFIGKKVAIFVHGCYWHHCTKCDFPLPKHNMVFWRKKFVRNQERDKEKLQLLRKEGWKFVVVWEHEIKRTPKRVLRRIISQLP